MNGHKWTCIVLHFALDYQLNESGTSLAVEEHMDKTVATYMTRGGSEEL